MRKQAINSRTEIFVSQKQDKVVGVKCVMRLFVLKAICRFCHFYLSLPKYQILLSLRYTVMMMVVIIIIFFYDDGDLFSSVDETTRRLKPESGARTAVTVSERASPVLKTW